MIKFLRIRNLATIEDLELKFGEGFSILTGETGSGKSIIIDAIRIILGEKAYPDSIRTGESEALIEAGFDVSKAAPRLRDFGVGEDGELSIQRRISTQGAGKAYLNGILVPVKKLKEEGPAMADIYGQNDHVFLLNLENHLLYLDAFLGAEDLRRTVSKTARDLKSLFQEKRDLESRRQERLQRLDFLDYQIGEIERAGLKPGEDEALAQEREILKNAEKISSLVNQALDLSYVQEESLLPLLSRFMNALKGLLPYYPALEAPVRSVDDFSILLRELADTLVRYKDGNRDAPESLETAEERLNVIEKLKRKYGPGIPEILSYLKKIKAEADDLAASREKLGDVDKALENAFALYTAKAGELTALRIKKARELEKLIEKEISLLGMKKAAFNIAVRTTPPVVIDPSTVKENGTDEVEFLISPNPGEELRPLRKIASGGELSRVMLALKSLGKDTESSRTLIFDEIDSGIGGKTADFIAAKLKDLARKHQVICITHLPQIAASASHHIRIDKKFEKDRTFTTAERLSDGERIEEIARLISGTRITRASLQIAKEMLDGNPAPKKTTNSRGSS